MIYQHLNIEAFKVKIPHFFTELYIHTALPPDSLEDVRLEYERLCREPESLFITLDENASFEENLCHSVDNYVIASGSFWYLGCICPAEIIYAVDDMTEQCLAAYHSSNMAA